MAKSKPRKKPVNAPSPSSAGNVNHFEIAERLIEGQAPDAVIAALVSGGMAANAARYEVERAVKSPYLGVAARYAMRVAKRDWVLDIHAQLAAQENDALCVPIIDRIDPTEFFSRFYQRNRPVVLTGLINDWPALAKWSFDYLESLVGDREVGVQWDREDDPDYEPNCADHKLVMPLRDVIARIRAGASNDFYVTANNTDVNHNALAPLWADVGTVPGLLEKQQPRDGYVWLGPQGTITPWHHDLSNNWLLQIVGRKRVRLVAAHDTHRMRNHFHIFTQHQAEDLPVGPGDDMHPPVLECTIGPGEGLFIPVGWWHHVEALDATIGMSFLNFAAPNDHQTNYRAYGDM